MNWTAIIVIGCILASFIFAVLLGAFLGDKAQDAQNTTPPAGDPSSITPPKADKAPPQSNLHAYFADMTGADPEISLSEQTAAAREMGNALFFDLRSSNGTLMYTTELAQELGYSVSSNLKLDRLRNHLEYYADYAVALFESDFSSSLSAQERMSVQSTEALLLKEATDVAFSQIIIEFPSDITRDNAIYYQAYLLNLKLACPGVPIGVKLPYVFISDPDNSGTMDTFLNIADFYALDLGGREEAELSTIAASLAYFNTRYDGVIMLDYGDSELLEARINALLDKGVKNYIVK